MCTTNTFLDTYQTYVHIVIVLAILQYIFKLKAFLIYLE